MLCYQSIVLSGIRSTDPVSYQNRDLLRAAQRSVSDQKTVTRQPRQRQDAGWRESGSERIGLWKNWSKNPTGSKSERLVAG